MKAFALILALFVAGCASTPSATTQIALQEVTAIAVRRAVSDNPRAAEKVANIRAIATQLLTVTSVATVSDLRALVDVEVAKLNLNPIDAADAKSLLNIFQALLTERLGKDEIDADALVKVNEFVGYILAALPPV
jgi:hypothetical protein